MAIRPARPADIMRIVRVMCEGHAKSIYRDKGCVDERYARSMIATAIQKHGHTHHGGQFLLVAHEGDDITGYYWAFLDRVYQVGDKLSATEIHCYTTERCHPKDSLSMLRQFVDWAHKVPDTIEVLVGKTDIIAEDDGSYERYLHRKGFAEFGRIYRLPIFQQAEEVAA